MKSLATLSAALVLASAGVAMAAPAWADDLNGSYTQTIIDGGGRMKVGFTSQVTYTPCGSGCVTETSESGGPPLEYHLQGDDYIYVAPDGNTVTINRNTLLKTGKLRTTGGLLVQQLTKN
ncbi:hypothetical protein A5791_06905 [Mycobacterium sp. 852002-51163_SCH5372311]|nr:hypothetical protein A5791_06905 [Mycobacterium sp. 852002-51163_SCH5372311]